MLPGRGSITESIAAVEDLNFAGTHLKNVAFHAGYATNVAIAISRSTYKLGKERALRTAASHLTLGLSIPGASAANLVSSGINLATNVTPVISKNKDRKKNNKNAKLIAARAQSHYDDACKAFHKASEYEIITGTSELKQLTAYNQDKFNDFFSEACETNLVIPLIVSLADGLYESDQVFSNLDDRGIRRVSTEEQRQFTRATLQEKAEEYIRARKLSGLLHAVGDTYKYKLSPEYCVHLNLAAPEASETTRPRAHTLSAKTTRHKPRQRSSLSLTHASC